MLVAVRFDRITMDKKSDKFVLILKDDVSSRWLPIVVGTTEAQSIAMQVEKIVPKQPPICEIIIKIVEAIDAQITRVIIHEMQNKRYYSLINIKHNDQLIEIGVRPSDAIDLALRVQAPIFVSETIMAEAAISGKV